MRFRAPVLAVLGLVVFLALWEAAPRLGLVDPMMLPVPSALPKAFLREVASGMWGHSIAESIGHYLMGLTVGASLGAALGILTGMFRPLEEALSGVIRVFRPIPGLAWVPFAIMWFGATLQAAVFIIATGVFWIVFFAAHGAVRGVSGDLVEVAEAFGFHSPWSKLVKIIVPAAMPGLLVGLRTALGQAWMAVVAAELFGVPGLGQRMMQASSLLATDVVVIYMLTMAALYGIVDTGFVALQGWLLRWRA